MPRRPKIAETVDQAQTQCYEGRYAKERFNEASISAMHLIFRLELYDVFESVVLI